MSNYNSEKFDLSCNDISSIDFINKLQSFILYMRKQLFFETTQKIWKYGYVEGPAKSWFK